MKQLFMLFFRRKFGRMKTLHILLDGLQLMSSTDWELRFDLPAGDAARIVVSNEDTDGYVVFDALLLRPAAEGGEAP